MSCIIDINIRIKKLIKEWKKETGDKGVVQFRYDIIDNSLYIYTYHIEKYIRDSNELLLKYSESFRNLFGNNELEIKFIQTCYYWV